LLSLSIPLYAEAADPEADAGSAPSTAGAKPAEHRATPSVGDPKDRADGPAPAKAAAAYEFQPDVICPFCTLTPDYPTGRTGLHWHNHWQTAGTREFITIPALVAGWAGIQLFASQPSQARWKSPILFDRPMRRALRIGSEKGRSTASIASDWIFVWEIVHPSAIDPLLVAWWQRKAPFVAWQMTVINAQAYALTLLVTEGVKRGAARQRPRIDAAHCAQDPGANDCGATAYQSFFSGHAAVTATGAGLICAHHTQLNLYQSDFLDGGTCLLAVLGTATTGAMRIASDNHWTSDVLFGHLVGYASGYLLPTLLYYQDFRVTPHEHEPSPAPVYATLPMITRESLGLVVAGIF
jgi:membrane-associated phospholipid phosphatase